MIKNFTYFLFPSIIQALVGIIIIVPVTTFYLEPRDFGVIAILFVIMSPISAITSAPEWVLGGNYFQSDAKSRRTLVFNILIVDLLYRSIPVIIFWFLKDIILIFLKIENYENINLVYNLILFGTWLGLFWPTLSKLLIIQGNAKKHFFLEITKFIVGALITILSISYFKLGTISIILGFISTNIYSLILEIYFLKKEIFMSFDLIWIKRIFKISSRGISTSLTATLPSFIERFSIQNILGLTGLGFYIHAQIYSNSFKFLNKATNFAITKSSIKAYSNNDKKLISSIEKLLGIIFYILVLSGIMLTLFIGDIVNILTHGKFNESAKLVPLLYFLILFFFYGILPTQFLIAKSKSNTLFLSELIATLFSVAAIYYGVYYFGLKGAVVGVVISNLITQVMRKVVATKLGSKFIIDRYFWIGIIIYLIFYLIELIVDFNFISKIIIALTIFIIITYLLLKNIDIIKIKIKKLMNDIDSSNEI